MTRKYMAFTILCSLLMLATVPSPPSSAAYVPEWTEMRTFQGNCSSVTLHFPFTVNDTVVRLKVILDWTSPQGVFDLDLSVEDQRGYVVAATTTDQRPETMVIDSIPGRGRWTVTVIPSACGPDGLAEYGVIIYLDNVVLPSLEIEDTDIVEGESLLVNASSPHANVTGYMFDFGDGTNTSWLVNGSAEKEFSTPGTYGVRVKAKYSDGTESEWSAPASVSVSALREPPNYATMAVALAVGMGLLFLLAYLVTRGKGGDGDDRASLIERFRRM